MLCGDYWPAAVWAQARARELEGRRATRAPGMNTEASPVHSARETNNNRLLVIRVRLICKIIKGSRHFP